MPQSLSGSVSWMVLNVKERGTAGAKTLVLHYYAINHLVVLQFTALPSRCGSRLQYLSVGSEKNRLAP